MRSDSSVASVKWRVIPLQARDAHANMALDEAVSEAVSRGESPPTIRFYTWKPSAVSIGYFQGLEDEVDVALVKEKGFDFVRRRTGGGAVYHDTNGEVTYSVIAPESFFPKGITESYRVICGWIVEGLKGLGIEAEFKPINDVAVKLSGKKISGNAQTRRNGVLLQHGTMLYDLDVVTMFQLLKVPREKISDKMIQSVEERVTCVKKHNADASLERAYKALLHGFTEGKEFGFGEYSGGELARARELVESRYSTREWNYLK